MGGKQRKIFQKNLWAGTCKKPVALGQRCQISRVKYGYSFPCRGVHFSDEIAAWCGSFVRERSNTEATIQYKSRLVNSGWAPFDVISKLEGSWRWYIVKVQPPVDNGTAGLETNILDILPT